MSLFQWIFDGFEEKRLTISVVECLLVTGITQIIIQFKFRFQFHLQS